MDRLQALYIKKLFLQNLIKEACINGEANHRIERLENVLQDLETEIDEANIALYA